MENIYYCKTNEESPLLEEYMEEWRNRKTGGRPIYVYSIDGEYRNMCRGISPKGWSDGYYASTIKCSNILAYNPENPAQKIVSKLNTCTNISKGPTLKLNYKNPNLAVQLAGQVIGTHQFNQFEKDIIDSVDTDFLQSEVLKKLLPAYRKNWDVVGVALYNKTTEPVENPTYYDKCQIIYNHYLLTKHKTTDHSWLKDVVLDAVITDKESMVLFKSKKLQVYYYKNTKTLEVKIGSKCYTTPIRFIDNEISI